MGRDLGWSGRLAVVATSYRQVGFGRLGTFVVSPDAHEDLQSLKAALGAEELVYLATCNRVECYLLSSSSESPSAEQLTERVAQFFQARGANVPADTFFAKTGRDAAEHLLSVVSSLDSLMVGETEIAGQARRAADRAVESGLCTRALRDVFKHATACSRRVRAETAIGSTPVSIATIAVQKIRKHFGKKGPGVSVLVGVGEMTRKVAQALAGTTGKRIVVNRTLANAEAFCAEHGGIPMSLEAFKQNPPGWIDMVFTATSAEETVIEAADLAPAIENRRKAGCRAPLIVSDLGLPRDTDPALDAEDGVYVVHMEMMEALSAKNRAHLEHETELARAIVSEEVSRLLREEHFRCLAGVSTEAMLDSQLPHLQGEDRAAIVKFVTGLARRMARQPMDLTG